jgi:copper transport protein
MFAVTVLVLAGTAQALVEIGTVSALTGTTYGRLVLLKVALLAIVLLIAAFSRRIVNRHFALTAQARVEADVEDEEEHEEDLVPIKRNLRRGVIFEVAIAAIVLGVTSVLVQTTPARSAEAAQNSPAEPFSVTLTDKLFKLEVDIAPAETGLNTIHLYAFAPDGSGPQNVAEWKGTAALPEKSIEPTDIPLLAITPDHSSGQILLPNAGTWELHFTVRIDDTNQSTVLAKVPIK